MKRSVAVQLFQETALLDLLIHVRLLSKVESNLENLLDSKLTKHRLYYFPRTFQIGVLVSRYHFHCKNDQQLFRLNGDLMIQEEKRHPESNAQKNKNEY